MTDYAELEENGFLAHLRKLIGSSEMWFTFNCLSVLIITINH